MTVDIHTASDCAVIKCKGQCERFPLPLESGPDLRGSKAVCVIHSRRAIIRIAPVGYEKITDEWVFRHFPIGDRLNQDTHVFSYEVMNSSVVFMAALPRAVLNSALDICGQLNIKEIDIKQADVAERRLFMMYLNGIGRKWLCFPLDSGIRILETGGSAPAASYFISNDPDYRDIELSRLAFPEEAVIFNGCGWLRDSLQGSGIKITEGGDMFEAV